MGGAETRPEEVGRPEGLSDSELIEQFCATRADERLAAELWRRHGDTLYDELKRLTYRRNSFCPYFSDRRSFLDASFSRAYCKYFGGICRARILKAWLRVVARTAALEEYRSITRSRTDIEEVSLDEAFPHDLGEGAEGPALRRREMFPTPEEDLKGTPSTPDKVPPEERKNPPFRSRYLKSVGPGVMAQQPPPLDDPLIAKERKFIVRELLVRHYKESER